MSNFDVYVSTKDLANYFRVSDDYVKSQAQFEVLPVLDNLEVVSSTSYLRLSKVLYSQAPSLCVYTLDSVTSKLRGVYDKREFIDKFLDSKPKSIVQDLFTDTLYYWSDDIVGEYYEFVKSFQSQLHYSLERVATRLGLSASQLYSLVHHLGLRLTPLVGVKTKAKTYILPKRSHATVCSFLSQHRIVELTDIERSRLNKMGITPLYIRGVGTLLEVSVLNYLRDSVTTSVTEIEGVSYLSYNAFLSKFSLTPDSISATFKSLLVKKKVSADEFVAGSLVNDIETLRLEYRDLDIRLLLLVSLGLLPIESALDVVTVSQFKAYYNHIADLGVFPLTKAIYKYLAESSKLNIFRNLQLTFYSKDLFV